MSKAKIKIINKNKKDLWIDLNKGWFPYSFKEAMTIHYARAFGELKCKMPF